MRILSNCIAVLFFFISPQFIFANISATQNSMVKFQEVDCNRKKKVCTGVKVWEDGAKYEGDFKFGEPNGLGRLITKEGDVYKGAFKDGLFDGDGVYTFENGDVYSGEWVRGQKHGKGSYAWSNGSTYVGSYLNGLMEGEGKIVLENGESYEGEWKQGLAWGQGTFLTNEGGKHIGKYKAGKRNGMGIVVWRTGDTMQGKWNEGVLDKKMDFNFTNGDTMNTVWSNGEVASISYKASNGKEIKGTLNEVKRELKTSSSNELEVAQNIALLNYVQGLEYIKKENFSQAEKALKNAIKDIPLSSDLSKLIHAQLNKLLNAEASAY